MRLQFIATCRILTSFPMLHHIVPDARHGCITYVLGIPLTILLWNLLGQVVHISLRSPPSKGQLIDLYTTHWKVPKQLTVHYKLPRTFPTSQKPFAYKNTENTGLNWLPWPQRSTHEWPHQLNTMAVNFHSLSSLSTNLHPYFTGHKYT
jgi:hypothetical protein